MKKGLVFALVTALFLCSWNTQPKTNIKKAGWLVGTWENKTQRGSIYETWAKVSDHELTGKSFMLKEKDSVIFETISLIQEQNKVFYIPKVKNQNNGSSIRFPAKIISAKKLLFENREHDFPQTISYNKITPDSLVAEISGVKNGKLRRQIFAMRRIK